MTTLTEVQAGLAQLVQRRRALPLDAEAVRFANEHLAPSDRMSAVEQLEIYREQFWLRHTAALAEDFPGVGGIVGQKAWERLVEDYLSAHPPVSFTLRDLGDKFPQFVEEQKDLLEHHEIVTDMARLEWAYVEVFDAEAGGRLSVDDLAGQSPEAVGRARLIISPTLRLLRVNYPVIELRKRILLAADEPVLLPETEALCLAIYRSELEVRHERLTFPAFALLQGLMLGKSLEMACEAVCALGDGASAQLSSEIGEWLATWVQLGWVVRLEWSLTRAGV